MLKHSKIVLDSNSQTIQTQLTADDDDWPFLRKGFTLERDLNSSEQILTFGQLKPGNGFCKIEISLFSESEKFFSFKPSKRKTKSIQVENQEAKKND